MHLDHLSLEDFRNHSKLELDFSEARRINYIVGPNAFGKTNILEAIYLLALSKSFRASTLEDLIGWGCEFARVKGSFDGADRNGPAPAADTYDEAAMPVDRDRAEPDGPAELEVFLGNPPHPKKSLKKNGVKTTAENFIGNCKVVLFTPEDLNLLYLGPDLRRRYLDILNLQVKRDYYSALRNYKKTIEQRNSLLRLIKEGRSSSAELDLWDEKLAEYGSKIILERAKTTAFFHQNLQEKYRQISQKEEQISVEYKCSGVGSLPGAPADNGLRAQTLSHAEIQTAFTKKLSQNRTRDLEAGITTSGPHRDDLVFSLEGRNLVQHASRGEYRSIVLAMKILEMEYHAQISGTRPIVLLDDVFSELDDNRRSMLVSAIQDHQIFITSTKIGDHFIERTHKSLAEHAKEPNIFRVGVEG
jgi:DNA replication and repair protein RecF